MSRVIAPPNGTGNGHVAGHEEIAINSTRLHRLGMVRTRERISRKAVALRLGVSTSEVKSLEAETSDMPLSTLYKWQEALGVPAAELLAEPSDSLSPPVWNRAELVCLMKTSLAILDRTQEAPVKHLAQTMINQLIEVMPELPNSVPFRCISDRYFNIGRHCGLPS